MEESKSVSGAPAWGVAKILYQQRNVPGLVICYVAIENGPVEIVDLPMKHADGTHSYVTVYQRVT